MSILLNKKFILMYYIYLFKYFIFLYNSKKCIKNCWNCMKSPIFAPVKYEDLQYMHYLDCVIKETLTFPYYSFTWTVITLKHIKNYIKRYVSGDIVFIKKYRCFVSYTNNVQKRKILAELFEI